MPGSIHVVSPVAGFGNRLDLELVAKLLEENGFDVTRYGITDRTKLGRGRKIAERLLKFKGRFDVNIFLAPLFPEWLPMARKNLLVPNVEGFPDHLRKWLPKIDLVLAKTRLTERAFGEIGCKTEFTSFTSPDHLDESVPRERMKFFHSCSSQFKGTKSLLETWRKHLEWPELIAVINNHDAVARDFEMAPNIRAIRERLPFEELKRLQNMCVFHICCSEAEGFGHYIMEALSCGAIPFTTNAPAMNELIDPSRGLLVDAKDETRPMGLTKAYFFRPESLEQQVERAVALTDAEIAQMGRAGREFYVQNDQFFRRQFIEMVQAMVDSR